MSRLFILALLLVSMSAEASRFTDHYVVELPVGESETISVARERAIERITLQAAAAAGSYVQGTTRLRNDTLTEDIQLIAASMVSLSDQTETRRVTEDGIFVLRYAALATVDTAQLQARIAAMQRDQSLAADMEQLKRRNVDLRKQLDDAQRALDTARASAHDTATLRELARDSRLRGELAANRQSIQSVFDGGGLLAAASKQAEAFASVRQSIDTEILEPLLAIRPRVELLSAQRQGTNVLALVTIDWDVPQSVTRALERIIPSVRTFERQFQSVSAEQLRKNPAPHAKAAFDYLQQTRIRVVVRLGQYTRALPVLFGVASDTFFSDRSCSTGRWQSDAGTARLCLWDPDPEHGHLNALDYSHDEHPLRFEIPATAAGSITAVTARVEVVSGPFKALAQ